MNKRDELGEAFLKILIISCLVSSSVLWIASLIISIPMWVIVFPIMWLATLFLTVVLFVGYLVAKGDF